MHAEWNQERRVRVIALIEDCNYCPSDAGERCGVAKRTARRWWKNYKETGCIERKSGSGRLRVSSEGDDRRLFDNILTNPFLSCRQLGEVSQLPGSARTVRRRLKDHGLLCRRAAIKQRLTEYQKVDRMAYAEEYLDFDWSRFIFLTRKYFLPSPMLRFRCTGHGESVSVRSISWKEREVDAFLLAFGARSRLGEQRRGVC
ncbi:uncharacterized protein LOC126298284 [Schistocerca gregaria]|uniref:uncharacterized protein LOC126298284 n=1 Tax=Schistocerca gregaria TaxID=7010 RepID=UPI00211F35D8|nr:uncharacterized protein LOC126298284 [Schistocerca gregaria]